MQPRLVGHIYSGCRWCTQSRLFVSIAATARQGVAEPSFLRPVCSMCNTLLADRCPLENGLGSAFASNLFMNAYVWSPPRMVNKYANAMIIELESEDNRELRLRHGTCFCISNSSGGRAPGIRRPWISRCFPLFVLSSFSHHQYRVLLVLLVLFVYCRPRQLSATGTIFCGTCGVFYVYYLDERSVVKAPPYSTVLRSRNCFRGGRTYLC